MKIAVAIWAGRVSPVLDVSREVLVVTLENGDVVAQERASIDAATAGERAARIVALGAERLVCGAISEPLRHELTSQGVRVIGFVAGEIERVIGAIAADELPSAELSMPGCGGQLRRRRRRGQCMRHN